MVNEYGEPYANISWQYTDTNSANTDTNLALNEY